MSTGMQPLGTPAAEEKGAQGAAAAADPGADIFQRAAQRVNAWLDDAFGSLAARLAENYKVLLPVFVLMVGLTGIAISGAEKESTLTALFVPTDSRVQNEQAFAEAVFADVQTRNNNLFGRDLTEVRLAPRAADVARAGSGPRLTRIRAHRRATTSPTTST